TASATQLDIEGGSVGPGVGCWALAALLAQPHSTASATTLARPNAIMVTSLGPAETLPASGQAAYKSDRQMVAITRRPEIVRRRALRHHPAVDIQKRLPSEEKYGGRGDVHGVYGASMISALILRRINHKNHSIGRKPRLNRARTPQRKPVSLRPASCRIRCESRSFQTSHISRRC